MSDWAPRGLSRVEAAHYVGVGTTTFDQMVADGRMPKPKKINSRRVYDRLEIDQCFADLPGEGGEANPWDESEAA